MSDKLTYQPHANPARTNKATEKKKQTYVRTSNNNL